MNKSKIPTAPKHSEEEMFVTWDDDKSKKIAFSKASQALQSSEPIVKATHTGFRDIIPNTSVRQPFRREDYSLFRPNEAIPTKPKEIRKAAQRIYSQNGLIRNIIDLMADFACQGIGLEHEKPNERKFYQEWFKKVNGKDRSERFLNLFYRIGTVPVKRATAKLSLSMVKKLERGMAAPDVKVEPPLKIGKREIPWRYTFLNPNAIDILNNELVAFIGKPTYVLTLSANLTRTINHPRNSTERKMVESLPQDIKSAIKRGQKSIPLDPDKVRIFHYKKDDWSPWADPMTLAILDDVILLEKMKLADLAALDGAISHVRLWKLGDLENKILPTKAAISRLSDILISNVGGGSIDIIWGPAITLEETSTDVQRFLGNEKYVPVLDAIYAGLGIPPTLTGSSTASGFTNNFISLRTLIERLRYGRDVLRSFWEGEIKLVQRAMGFSKPASIIFDRMSLSDDAAEKALLIQLADRDLISTETLQSRFEEVPELEKARIKRENRERKSEQMPNKAGPWHDPQVEEALLKIFSQRGAVTPGEAGVELNERKDGEQSFLDMQIKNIENRNNNKKGEPQKGRPLNSKDKEPRNRRTFKPRTSAMMTALWAKEAQQKISDIINPIFLDKHKKKNMRSLSSEQFDNVEKFKFYVLFKLNPFSTINKSTIAEIVNQPLSLPSGVNIIYDKCVGKFSEQFHRLPDIDELRIMQTNIYTFFSEVDNGED